MRPYYSDYVKHMMKQYIKLHGSAEQPAEGIVADNIAICDKMLSELMELDRSYILDVYQNSTDFLNEGINKVSEQKQISPMALWPMVKNFEKKVAKERGLL